VRAPFPYYGGKARLATYIAGLLPPHRIYVEVCSGSAAVFFAKAPSAHEILNDIDGNVVVFFRVLRDHPAELQRACMLTPYARDEYHACDLTADVDDIERARRFFARATQSYNANGTFPGRSSWAPSIRQGGSKADATRRRADALHLVAERLRDVTIEHRDALEVVEHFDTDLTTFYVDPPYLGSTRASLGASGRRARDYAHDMTSVEEHTALAHALNACRGAVVLSGYRSQLYDDLYDGWHRVEVAMQKPASNRRGTSSERAHEVLWSNRPLAVQTVLDPTLAA
jgi:DNA adenine methylase